MNTTLQRQNILKTFIREDITKQPRGIAVAIRDGDTITYGFSLLNTKLDRFDKVLGTNIAINRAMALSFLLPAVPERQQMVIDAFKRLEVRAIKYFKDLNPENIKITQEDFDVEMNLG